ncbi:MAG: carbohydrate ABC transporter permease [Deinococcales bacterium]
MSVAAQDLPRVSSKKMRKGVHPVILAVVWIGAILWLVPIVGSVLTSLRTFDDFNNNGFWSIPETLTLDNYVRAWGRMGINKYLLNSFIITLPALVGCIMLASMCAYALVRFQFRLAKPLYFMFVGGLLLPFQMLLLPVFRLTNDLGIHNTYWALIFFHTAFQLAFCTFVLRNFMKTVPASLFESAMIDGAGEWTIFLRIAFPLMLPGIASLATLEFTWIFNDYLWALVLITDNALKPITTGLANLRGQFTTDYPLIVAGSILACVPTLVVFFALQRYFIGGLTVGATKG